MESGASYRKRANERNKSEGKKKLGQSNVKEKLKEEKRFKLSGGCEKAEGPVPKACNVRITFPGGGGYFLERGAAKYSKDPFLWQRLHKFLLFLIADSPTTRDAIAGMLSMSQKAKLHPKLAVKASLKKKISTPRR
jgi:hypothetical protein